MAQMNGAENLFVSCDSEGLVKTWDKRMMKCSFTVDCGPYSANALDFEHSGKLAVMASDDFTIKVLDIESQK
jgi:WD40 repeat protein